MGTGLPPAQGTEQPPTAASDAPRLNHRAVLLASSTWGAAAAHRGAAPALGHCRNPLSSSKVIAAQSDATLQALGFRSYRTPSTIEHVHSEMWDQEKSLRKLHFNLGKGVQEIKQRSAPLQKQASCSSVTCDLSFAILGTCSP